MNDLILNDFPLYWFFDSSPDLIRRDKVLDIISLAMNRSENAEEIKTLGDWRYMIRNPQCIVVVDNAEGISWAEIKEIIESLSIDKYLEYISSN